MDCKQILLFSLLLSACSTADYTPAPQLAPVEAGRIVAAATATEDAARVTATFVAWAPGATSTQLANDRAALALTPTAASVALQMTAEADSAMLTARARHDNATVQAALSNATMQALTPTPTPYPTPTNTPDAYATQRAVKIADIQGYGGLVFMGFLCTVVVIGIACILGGFANRIEGEKHAREIEAQGKADAERTIAEAKASAIEQQAQADLERSRMSVVQPGARVVINSQGTVQVLSIDGIPDSQVASDIKPLAPIARMAAGQVIEPLDRLSDLERQAVQYLEHCAHELGWEAQRLPAASVTADNGERQAVVNALKAAGATYTKRGNNGGTWLVGRYETIRALHDALSEGAFKLQDQTTQTS